MSTTLTNLIDESRALLLEPVARFFSDTEITRWANYGIRDWSQRVLWYRRIQVQKVIANQYEYALPSDVLKVELIRWQDRYRVRLVDESTWSQNTFVQSANQSIPDSAILYPVDKFIALNPPPSSAGAATVLSGNINSSVTTIPVTSTTGFPSRGRIIIGTEQILYYAVDSTNFLQCRRGDADTTAAAHNLNDAVDEGRLVLYTRALPPDLVSGSDVVKLPDQYVPAISLYVAYRGFVKRQDAEKAQLYLGQYKQSREEAAYEMLEKAKDGSEGVKDEEHGMGFFGGDL